MVFLKVSRVFFVLFNGTSRGSCLAILKGIFFGMVNPSESEEIMALALPERPSEGISMGFWT